MPDIFVDVLLPLPVNSLYTYTVPHGMAGVPVEGKRVIVPFGKQKIYSALIKRVHPKLPGAPGMKEVQSILDEFPVVNQSQFKLWEWMAAYYMCTEGEVMNSALPASLKLKSETKILLGGGYDPEVTELSGNEEILLDALKERSEISVAEVMKLLDVSNVYHILKKALDRDLIQMTEEISQRYKPRIEKHIRFSSAYADESAIEKLFNDFEKDSRKAKQLETLMVFIKFLFEDPSRASVKKSVLLQFKDVSASSVSTLISTGVLVEFDVVIDRIPVPDNRLIPALNLSDAQHKALVEVKSSMEKNDVTLLHGVTSSGKTEIYIHLIEDEIRKGRQVLYLLPEIALTTQLIVRLQKYFGDKVGVYHSRYSGNERTEVWNHVLNFSNSNEHNRSQIVLGPRSALFLPYRKLGLVIIDEEHDQSFKQQDPAPRYNGRDTAIVLAKIHSAKVVLGSATPSLESYYNAGNNRYGLVNLTERYGGIQMPEIIIADVKEAQRKKLMKSHFTPELVQSIQQALSKNEQIILFQNRRGFSNYLECRNCNHVPHCKNCTVTLTYHKQGHILKCHYCGFVEVVPTSCSNCGDFHIEVRGFGTEKIEEEISILFPDARVARMDLDTTRTKTSFQKIIGDFEDRKIDILVGTQMVTKGLDFDNITTVGIINADQLLNFPDFRSFERSYQLMAQVSGRSGRKHIRGKVIIQTSQPGHWVIQDVVANDYVGFYKRDLIERRQFEYPPHSRLIELTLRHKEMNLVQEASHRLVEILRAKLGDKILGPHIPMIERIRNLFYRKIIVKIERTIQPGEVKKTIRECISELYKDRSYLSVQIYPDVDPL